MRLQHKTLAACFAGLLLATSATAAVSGAPSRVLWCKALSPDRCPTIRFCPSTNEHLWMHKSDRCHRKPIDCGRVISAN